MRSALVKWEVRYFIGSFLDGGDLFKFGFVEQFEPRGNRLCDPHPSPPQELATPSPEGKASVRKRDVFPDPEICFLLSGSAKSRFSS